MSVLIVTMPGDVHAHALRWAIEQLGGDAHIFYPADLSNGARWSFDPTTLTLCTEYRARRETLTFKDYSTVWMRRTPRIIPQEHVEDRVERAISEDDFGTFARSIYLVIEHKRFAVNPLENTRRASLKPYQLAMAADVGLTTPRTLVSNAPDAIIDFYEANGGNIVFKPFRGQLWTTEVGAQIVPTTPLTREILRNCDLAAAPGIFQENIAKRCEIRATIMGRSVFAWEKSFEGRDDLDVDWRLMFKDARHAKRDLPPDIEQACFALMDKLGLVFGCFDFVVDGEGRYFFLEVNPQGQWLWGDVVNDDLNQLEAMAEFLICADPHFQYSGRNRFRLSDYPSDLLDRRTKVEAEQHFGNIGSFAFHQESFRANPAAAV